MSPKIAKQIVFCITLTCILSAWSPHALALDPALDVSQYGHTAWRIRDGFSNQLITAFAQTSDGYLWLGTQSDCSASTVCATFHGNRRRARPFRTTIYERSLRRAMGRCGSGPPADSQAGAAAD